MASLLDQYRSWRHQQETERFIEKQQQPRGPGPYRQNILDEIALATSPIPYIGAVSGVAADVHRMAQDPEERTPGKMAMSLGSMIPGAKILGMARGPVEEITSEITSKFRTLDDAKFNKLLANTDKTYVQELMSRAKQSYKEGDRVGYGDTAHPKVARDMGLEKGEWEKK